MASQLAVAGGSVATLSGSALTRAWSDRLTGHIGEIELSVVMPCLNESDTLAICIEKAQRAILENNIVAEIVIADNGSKDASPEIASSLGCRVVHVEAKGYGNALMGGINAARGKYVIMGDCDDSYDFLEIPRFVDKLREGYDLVQGCRLPSGGGTVLPGAMPPLHRWWGNPMFSWMAKRWFRAPIHDIYCGLRGFTKTLYARLDQRCTGMEFATEMIIKSSLYREKISEVPITLHPDGRLSHPPHLKTFRDGWRTLRFFLMYSPRSLFLWPGCFLIALGVIGYALALAGVTIGHALLGAHTLLFASVALLCGCQAVQFAVFTKIFAIREGMMPPDHRLEAAMKVMPLERTLVVGAAGLVLGIGLLIGAILQWRAVDYGALDYAHTMRWAIPGATLTALGFQTILASFFASILEMRRK